MKRYTYLLVLMLLAVATACQDHLNGSDQPKPETSDAAFVDCEPGQLLVKFAPEMSEILDRLETDRQAVTRCGLPSTDEVLSLLGAYRLERVFPIDTRHEGRTRENGLHLWYTVYFDEKQMSVEEAYRQMSRLGEVQTLQPNRRIYPSHRQTKPVLVSPETLASPRTSGAVFDDPYLSLQWHYINQGNLPFEQSWAPSVAGCDVNCQEAWELCTGDSSIVVAVMDEGVMWQHPDLTANMWVNPGERYGSDMDADGNGYCGDQYGFNFVRNSGLISCYSVNDTGHGTHIAGTIAAVNHNGIGVCGIAGGDGQHPGVRIMSLQIFDNAYNSSLVAEAKAFKYAADNGAHIVQCSWGYNSDLANPLDGFVPGPADEEEWSSLYPLEKEAIDYFIHYAGSPNGVLEGGLAIFASGNEYSASSAFPAAYDKCLSVSATAADYTPSSYTNYGKGVDLCAPGGDDEYYSAVGEDRDIFDLSAQGMILSTLINNGEPAYGYYEGTSMACPHVTGVAALGLSYAAQLRRHFTWKEFQDLLISSSRRIDDYYAQRGEKVYHLHHIAWGSPLVSMDLNQYRGKMGRFVDAGALLKAIEQSGSDMILPNILVQTGRTYTLDLSRFYLDGENLKYTFQIADTKVAKADLQGSVLEVTGVSEGSTKLTVRTSNGNEQTVTVTVRKEVKPNGWL